MSASSGLDGRAHLKHLCPSKAGSALGPKEHVPVASWVGAGAESSRCPSEAGSALGPKEVDVPARLGRHLGRKKSTGGRPQSGSCPTGAGLVWFVNQTFARSTKPLIIEVKSGGPSEVGSFSGEIVVVL